jgi:uncharacterized ion transporter superfamily protein YfcC
MIAAGYDALTGAASCCSAAGSASSVDDQPVRHRDRLRVRRDPDQRRHRAAAVILIVGSAIGIFFVMRYAERVKKDPTRRWSTT